MIANGEDNVELSERVTYICMCCTVCVVRGAMSLTSMICHIVQLLDYALLFSLPLLVRVKED